MSDTNLQLVREFFELNLFSVLTHWQDPAFRPRPAESSVLLFVENLHPPMGDDAPDFVLAPESLPALHRAVVDIRAWHADRFYPSVIKSSAVLGQFVAEDSLHFARQVFGTPEFATILVISELPASPGLRTHAIDKLRDIGIGHVLEFPVLLRDLLDKISGTTVYPSQTLQTLRLLKRYRFLQRQQLEFAFPLEPVVPITSPQVDASDAAEEEETEE
ncbi:MAG TPA: hypothetical protein ENN80_05845 [Candidatus Hydrogenedentes bacterium]|nr:hypothetical protein [Candidatus Hydrogenedentota bacterium]